MPPLRTLLELGLSEARVSSVRKFVGKSLSHERTQKQAWSMEDWILLTMRVELHIMLREQLFLRG